jgi:uncharacterized protein YhaN
MKINRMRLIAYGPFSDTPLDFSDSQTAFHLVYGPNEAGKSTALRALRNMLFGIPARTPDSFRYPHPKLRIGAELIRSDGEKISFIRRKGLRKTLRAVDDQSLLDDGALASFLGGVSRDLFEQMFAIDHQDLIQGGEEIISGGGSIGQALFAAGAGLIQLQRFQQHLDQTMDALFKPSGSKPRINHTLSSLKNTRKDQKNALLLAKTWKTHHENLQDAEAQLEVNRQHLAELKQAYGTHERMREALPLIARRKEIHDALLAFEDVPDLPEDFGEKRREVENTLTIATNDVKRIQKTITACREKISALSVPEELLRHAPMIEALQHDLGSFKKAQQDRPVLEARMRALSKQALAKLSQAGIARLTENGNHLRMTPVVIGEIQEMGQTYERLVTRLESIRERRRQLETEISALEEKKQTLPSPKDVSALKAILVSAQSEGPLEKRLAETRNAMAHREKTLINLLKRQSLWSGSLEELEALPWPSRESVDRFENQFSRLAQQIERRQTDNALLAEELAQIDTELQMIEITHDVPTEENLIAARDLRDAGWRLIRRKVEGNDPAVKDVHGFTEQFRENSSLPNAFEESMDQADLIADRLRREAEHVSRKSMLEARKHQAEKERQKETEDLHAARTRRRELEQQWQTIWAPSGIMPHPPAEMRTWLSDMTSIREKTVDLRLKNAQTVALASEIATLKTRITTGLTHEDLAVAKDQPLAELIGLAQRYVESQETLRTQIDASDKTLGQHRKGLKNISSEMTHVEKDLDRWRIAWAPIVDKIGLAAEASPTAALSVIESIREARTQQDEASVLEKRIRGIDRDAQAFRERVNQLVNSLARELIDASPEEAGVLLNAKLTEARASQSRQGAIRRQLDAAQIEQEKAKKRRDDATSLMQSLLHEAGCGQSEMLPEIENRSRKRRQLNRENEDIDNRLRRLSAGATVEAFVAKAKSVAPDSLVPKMEQLAGDITALEQERSALDQTVGTEKAELKRMDGRARAAGYAEDAEQLLASLESDVAQYARSKIASVILARTIEQYRKKHQGPLIKRASDLFAQMTRNAFHSVRAEYDEKGHPVLVGIRAAGDEPVTVAGMSDGTADQLYLALRLASLENYLDSSEPLPFVVDDILLRFDDDRAVATLKVLSDLSAKTQVIFFTHHQHLVELAQTAIGDSNINVHLLGDSSRAATSH